MKKSGFTSYTLQKPEKPVQKSSIAIFIPNFFNLSIDFINFSLVHDVSSNISTINLELSIPYFFNSFFIKSYICASFISCSVKFIDKL
ncbi:hypothetical protein HOF65_03195 [bacterium]|nr:hypothetical protein [bacterium]MBT3852997.1 hypothetical protein [bacterium]MBT4632625.1 hypothetical protein [bacterium]